MASRGGKFFRPGKKFLRPPANDDDDDSEDDDDYDHDEEEEANEEPQSSSSPPSKKNVNANLSSDDGSEDPGDDDEDDDDDDDDDDDEDYGKSKKRKAASSKPSKPKRHKASSFFDEEAEASEDDDDDDEPYGTHHDPHDIVKKHYTDEDIRREQMDEEAREMIRQQDRRRAQAGGMRFGAERFETRERSPERSVADLARDIEDRHRMQQRRVDRTMLDRRPVREETGVGGPESYSAVSQQSLLPSVSDPSMWMVSCSTGKEQEMILQIMNKCVAYARQGKPLGICGAVAGQSKGRIYIESTSEPAVMEAIQGIRGLLQYTMRLIPIQDMPTVMTVIPKNNPVKKGDWVRMTRGHYKGDLALVLAVRESGLKCIVQCVPRIDYTLSELPPEQARIRRRTVKPPQKFFNAAEATAMSTVDGRRMRFPGMDMYCDYFDGNYYLDGYLIKEMTVGSMVKRTTDEDPPTLDELQRFRKRTKPGEDGGDENAGSKMAASLLDELSEMQGKTNLGKSSSGGGLLIGDTVEVIEGDLIGLRGKIMSMDATTVKVKPNDAAVTIGGTGEIEFLANQVRKHIAVGAHVKVTDGRYANETGVVVAVERVDGENDFTAVVLTDITNKEISVRTSQVRESAEVASGQDKLAGYELYDLVVLSGSGSANEVGVIVRVGREDFTVINNHGISREVRPEELRGKRNSASNRAVALDVQGNQIRCGDLVNVAEGPHKGKVATIKRMSRAQLFLYSQTRSEHAGIFVVRSRSCVLSGSKAQSRGQNGDIGGSPFQSPQSQSRAPAARGRRDDALMGKTVRIQSGKWKGYLGAVSDATATHVQVELHSRLKKVMVARERVAVAGDKFGATENPDAPTTQDPNPIGAPTTPFVAAGATPMHGGATPMHGGATPMHDSGADEVWRPGAMDQDDTVTNDNGWNSTSTDTPGFGSSANDSSSGWGTSNQESTWTPASQMKQEPGLSHTNGTSNVGMQSTANGGMDSQSNGVKNEQGLSAGPGEDQANPWFMERVSVKTKSDEMEGVIQEINPDQTALIRLSDGSTRTVASSEITQVQPQEKDVVLVIGGADVGMEGELICIDDNDAILKDANEDFKIVDFGLLAKITDNG